MSRSQCGRAGPAPIGLRWIIRSGNVHQWINATVDNNRKRQHNMGISPLGDRPYTAAQWYINNMVTEKMTEAITVCFSRHAEKMHKCHGGKSSSRVRMHFMIVQIVDHSVGIKHTQVFTTPFHQTEVTNQQNQQHYPANRNKLTRFRQIFPPANITYSP